MKIIIILMPSIGFFIASILLFVYTATIYFNSEINLAFPIIIACFGLGLINLSIAYNLRKFKKWAHRAALAFSLLSGASLLNDFDVIEAIIFISIVPLIINRKLYSE